MCISAQVSFSLAGGLLAGGAYCVHKANRVDRSYLPLAIIPVVFGVQQFCEGWVWTGVAQSNPAMTKIAAMGFLFFAWCFWPIWIPLSALFIERKRNTKRFLQVMLALAVAIGLALMVPLLSAPSWLTIDVAGHSLHYNISGSPVFRIFPGLLWQALYFLVVATPLFVSSERKMVHVGLVVVLSAAVTHVFYDQAFASMWCFMAAALSLYLCTFHFGLPTRIAVRQPSIS